MGRFTNALLGRAPDTAQLRAEIREQAPHPTACECIGCINAEARAERGLAARTNREPR